MTATMSTPAFNNGITLSFVMPPIAQTGTFSCFLARVINSMLARGAEGLVGELKKLPKAI